MKKTQNDKDALATNAKTVENDSPRRKLDVAVSDDTVTLIHTTKTQELDADGQPQTVDTTDVIQMPISERSVNQYTTFRSMSNSFESSLASKSNEVKLALVKIDTDGVLSWYNLLRSDYVPIHDNTVWDLKLREFPGVKLKITQHRDTRRTRTHRKMRVDREAVESARGADGRLLVIKWRKQHGSSENSPYRLNFKSVEAVELIGSDN